MMDGRGKSDGSVVPESNRRQRGGGKPETFNFLGFTHSCAKTKAGKFTVLRQTMRKRWQAKLEEVKAELRRRLHDPVPEQGAYLRSVVTGHFRYDGVPLNGPALKAFRYAIGEVWYRVLRRRSQNHRITATRIRRLVSRWLPIPRICHPYPLVRLGVVTQGGSRMRYPARPDLCGGRRATGVPTATRRLVHR